MDVWGIIRLAYELYAKEYRKVVVPFIVMAVLSVGLSIALEVVKYGVSAVEPKCHAPQMLEGAMNPSALKSTILSLIACELTKPSFLLQLIIGILVGFLLVIVLFSSFKPLEDLVMSRPVSDWAGWLSRQVGNGIRFYLLELFTGFLSILPLFVTVLFFVPQIIEIVSRGGADTVRSELVDRILGSFLIFGVAAVLCVLIGTVIVVFLTFVRVELVLGRQGLVSAVRNSVSLVRRNTFAVFVFHLLWLFVSFAAGLVVFITCCFAVFVGPILSYMLITPVRIISEIMLWRTLKYGASDNVLRGGPLSPKTSN